MLEEIQPVHSKGDQSWVFIGRTDAKAETPVLWPPHAKSWLIGKDSDAGRDWGQEEKGTTKDEMDGLGGHEFEWTPGVGDGQGGLARCSPWGRKDSDTTERLNWVEWRSRYRQQTCGHGEKGGEGEMHEKSNMETYITICKIDGHWAFAVQLRKLKQGLCISLEGWDGEEGSKGRGYMYTYGWFMLRFDRKQQNSVKQLSFNKK